MIWPLKPRTRTAAVNSGRSERARNQAAPAARSPAIDSMADRRLSYSDISGYRAVLSHGPAAAVSVPRDAQAAVLVLEMQDGVLLLHTGELGVTAKLLREIRTALTARGFATVSEHQVDSSLIAQVLAAERAGSPAASGAEPRVRRTEHWALFQEIIGYAIKVRASDVHVYWRGSEGVVRYRVHGSVEDMLAPSRGRFPAAALRAALSVAYQSGAGKSNTDTQLPAEGMSAVLIPYASDRDGSWRLRMQVFASEPGSKVVLRLLPERAASVRRTLQDLGYSPDQLELWRQLTLSDDSAIVAGSTGSGKTTTLNVVMQMLPPGEVIYTLEDPVELPLDHPNSYQISIQRDLLDEDAANTAFGAVIAAVLRADVDTVQLGEIRDKASATAYSALARAGHRSLATLHADGIHGVMPRLTDRKLGLSRSEMCTGRALGLLCYQALPPLLCQECRIRADVQQSRDDEVESALAFITRSKLATSRFYFRREGGCQVCAGRGVIGQTVVAEMYSPDDEWLELVQDGKDRQALAHYRLASDGDWLSPDMSGKTVFEAAFHKAAEGLIDPRECRKLGGGFHRYAPLARRAGGLSVV